MSPRTRAFQKKLVRECYAVEHAQNRAQHAWSNRWVNTWHEHLGVMDAVLEDLLS